MDPETRAALNALNRAFYDAEARAFSDTRDHPWPGWARLLPQLRPLPRLRVLDVGCGNARFARFLLEQGIECEYTGLDSSPALLELARREVRGARLQLHDLVLDSPESLPIGPFELITLFGVTHHIPGEADRQTLLLSLSERLAAQGLLVFTSWQFAREERFARRVLPFDGEAIDPAKLEPGDQLLQWGVDGARRYCHATSEEERARLVAALPLELVDEYESDGRSGHLNRYDVLQRTS